MHASIHHFLVQGCLGAAEASGGTDIGGMLGPKVARVLYHQEALSAIAAAFEDRRISFILLKGEALSKVLYPQAAAE